MSRIVQNETTDATRTLQFLSKEARHPHSNKEKENEQPSICGGQMEDVVSDTT